ncbi:hypothetical protein KEJ51_00660 [Candidatus Bathyarchaeota archaeon]|nr:hypothetical protein [Candidatus Bathyarchaeota archaeon]MBS7629784.1 hypothetical protein [Candidatus Bathyarchaeota archaeon]
MSLKRMVFRWTSTPSLISIFTLLTSTVIIEILYIDYMSARGLESRVLQAGYLSIPYPYIPIIGILMVIITSWMNLTRSKAFVRARHSVKLPSILMALRMFESALLIPTIFAITLYLPYLVGSNWMILGLAKVEETFPTLKEVTSRLYGSTVAIMGLPPSWKYGLSQALSCIIVVVSTIILCRRMGRRVRVR